MCSCMVAGAITIASVLSPMTQPSTPALGIFMYQAEHVELGEPPHTERYTDIRQVREFPKTSAATTNPAGTLYRIYGSNGPFSGYSPGI